MEPLKDGSRVLSGPAAEVDGAYKVVWWNRDAPPLKFATLLPPPVEADKKAEAILPLGESPAGLRSQILYEGAKEGAPPR